MSAQVQEDRYHYLLNGGMSGYIVRRACAIGDIGVAIFGKPGIQKDYNLGIILDILQDGKW